MSRLVLASFVIFALCTFTHAAPQKAAEPLDTDLLDKVDIEALLNNTRVLKSNNNCLLDKGPCTAEARQLKSK